MGGQQTLAPRGLLDQGTEFGPGGQRNEPCARARAGRAASALPQETV